jgi:hypothetical protein
MLTFSDYLVEAQFSEDDFNRVLSVFTRRLPRMLGSKIYRYGGSDYVEKVGGGSRITFIFGEKAYGVRYKGGAIKGIDVWSKFDTSRGPDFFINVSSLSAGSIIGSIGKLAQIIKNPKAGDLEVKKVNESVTLDEMASRVTDKDFYNMVVNMYGANDARSVGWDQIKRVADKNDVLIPAYIRSQKIGRGQWNAVPGAGGKSRDDGDDDSSSKSRDDEDDSDTIEIKGSGNSPTLFIKVTAQDPETRRFLPTGDNRAAQELYNKIIGAIGQGDHMPTKKELRDPETLYGHLAQLVDFACKGTLKSLLIYGGPGTGKTYTIMKTIDSHGFEKGQDYVKLSGKASAVEIYKTLFMFRNNGLVVFDDLDSMWKDKEASNILKAALDTSAVREISWASNANINVSKWSDDRREEYNKRMDALISGEKDTDYADATGEDDEDEDDRQKKEKPERIQYPSTFEFKGRVIFISNLKKDEFDTAILSRSAKINMDLTPEEILQRMKSVLPGLGGADVPVERKQELLDHLMKMHKGGELDMLTMREFIKGLNILRSGAPNWKDLIQYA